MSPEEATEGKDIEVGEESGGVGDLQYCGVVGGQLSLVGVILGDQGQLGICNHW